MNLVFLAYKSLGRNRFRSATNVFAVAVAFFLLTVLSSFDSALDPAAIEHASTRMIVHNKIGITESLPLSYYERLKSYSGVSSVSPLNWFGGYYMQPDNLVTTYAVGPDSYLTIYPEITLSEPERQAWKDTRNGAIIGEEVAARTGWRIGDSIPLQSNIFTNRDSSRVWDIVVVGIFGSSEKRIDTNRIFIQYDYFNKSHTFGEDWTGLYVVSFDNPQNFSVLAKAIDSDTANSFHETKSVTESTFQQDYFKQIGDISFVIRHVIFAAFFATLLVVCASMYQHANEKMKDTAILRTFGFKKIDTLIVDLLEAAMIVLNGFVIGLIIAYAMIVGMAKDPVLQSILPGFGLSVGTIVIDTVYAAILTLISTLVSSTTSYRVNNLQTVLRG